MRMYTVSVTDRFGNTETQAYFKMKTAYSTFKNIVERGQMPWRNCMFREGDTLLIAETVAGDFLVELYEHTILNEISN